MPRSYLGAQRGKRLALTALVALSSSVPLGLAQDNSSSEMNFGNKTWSIVPADSPSHTPSRPHRSQNSGFGQPEPNRSGAANLNSQSAASINNYQAEQSMPAPEPETASSASSASSAQPMRLYGRIEELSAGTGAKIPLKLVAMTPIRDASLDRKQAPKLNGKASQTSLLAGAGIKDITNKKPLDAKIEKELVPEVEPSFPDDFRGTWSGELTVFKVDYDPSYADFDPEEAKKQQELMKVGITGKTVVTFYQGSGNRVEVQPTQVVFSTTVNAAEQMKSMANSQFGALINSAGLANNPALANMQVPFMFAMPLGLLGGNTGVTGNQISSQLMKNSLKDLGRGVMEQDVVSKDNDRNASGRVKTSYTESVMRFTRRPGDRLLMQAASVSYDEHGGYLNKVILSGLLVRGTAYAPNIPSMAGGAPQVDSMFAQPGAAGGGLESLFGGGGGAGLQNLFGGGSGGAAGLQNLFGGGAAGGGGSDMFGGQQGGQQGGGQSDYNQQLQQLLQEP